MTSEREQEGGTPPQAMLTVAAVARRLGVAPSTLRTWDRRYGLGPSAHTAGSHRRYSPSDVSRLTVMRGLVMEGVPPGEAAQIAIGTPVDPPAGPAAPADTGFGGEGFGGEGFGAADDPGGGLGPVPRLTAPQPVVALPFASRSARPRPVTGDAPGPLVPPAAAKPAAVPVSRSSRLPDGAGRAVWPVAPLAAQHLMRAPVPIDPPPGSGRGGAGDGVPPGSASAPSARIGSPAGDGDELPADGFDDGLDDVLAQVIAAALGRPEAVRRPSRAVGRPGWGGRSGGGRVISLPDATPRARGLARAAMSLDTHELSRLLRDAVGAYGVVGAWDTMVLPVLQGLGERWRVTGDGVDVEHAFCEATLAVLRGVSATLYRPRNIRPVLLACADGDYHTLPLHVLAAALAEAEVGCRMLGAGLPARALVAAVRRTGPSVVLLYARLPVRDGAVLRELPRQRPAPRVLLGGPGWEDADLPASAVRIDSLREAVDEVLAVVGS